MVRKAKSAEEQEALKAAIRVVVEKAADAGMPQDQIGRLLKADIAPLEWQMKFHRAAREADEEGGPFWIAAGGARGPGKSFVTMAQAVVDDCQRWPGLKVLFLRRVMKSAAESMEDLTKKVLHGIKYDYTPSNGRVSLPNGSRMLMGGFNTEKDIDNYLGIEYDEIVLEEATQLSDNKIMLLRGSIRSSIDGFRSRAYLTTNPGGVGHAWFKKHMVEGRPFLGGKTKFIPSTYKDNPFLKQEYIDYLLAIPGQLGKAWRDGDWDVFAGQAFPQFNPSTHVVKPFIIPENWYKWRGIDEGYTAPWACVWLARDPNTQRIYAYREAYAKQLTIRQQAQRIKEMTPEDEYIGVTYADPAMWSPKNMDGVISASADEYSRNGVYLTKGDNKRIAGKRKVDNLLANMPDGLPGIMIFETLPHLIDQLQNLPVDPNNLEDVDTDAEDHIYDATKYALTNVDAGVNVLDKTKERVRHPVMDIGIF